MPTILFVNLGAITKLVYSLKATCAGLFGERGNTKVLLDGSSAKETFIL